MRCKPGKFCSTGIPIFLVEPHPHGTYTEHGTPKDFRKEDAFSILLKSYAASQEGIKVITTVDKAVFYETPEDIGNITKIRKDIFADSIHLNDAGYALFKEIFIQELDAYL